MKNIFLIFLFFQCTNLFGQNQKIVCGFDSYLDKFENNYESQLKIIKSDFHDFEKTAKGNSFKSQNLNTITIPVVFHVLHNGEFLGQESNISQGKILEQLSVLNSDFSMPNSQNQEGFGTPADAKFQFCLAKTDPFGQPTTGIVRSRGKDFYLGYTATVGGPRHPDDRLLKSRQWNPNIYLNVYITDLRPSEDPSSKFGFGGYSSFSETTVLNGFLSDYQSAIDGVVVNYRHIDRDPNFVGPPFISTMTHEVAHWLGLFHIWNRVECDLANLGGLEPDCSVYGDEICDTPPLGTSTLDNALGPFAEDCYTGNIVSSENFLDYGFERTTFFTEQQVEKMHQKTAFYRESIYNQTHLNVDCSIKNSNTGVGGSGGSTENGSCSSSDTDPYGFKIKSQNSGSFGKTLSIDDNILVVSDPANKSAHIFSVEEDCRISEDTVLTDSQTYSFAEHVYVKDGNIFVSSGGSVRIFEKESGIWKNKQTIIGSSSDFGLNILLRKDELIITSGGGLSFYKHNGNTYELQWGKNTGNIDSVDNDGLVYNGDFIAVTVEHAYYSRNGILLFHKGPNGSFSETNSTNLDIPTIKLALTDSPKNQLYTNFYGDDTFVFDVYDLNTFDPVDNEILKSSSFELVNNYWSAYDGVSAMYLQNDMIVLPRKGDGTSFHHINDLTNNIPVKDEVVNDKFLRPSPYNFASTLGKTSALSGNHLVVGNWYCNEVFVYDLSSLILDELDFQFCEAPTGDLISGKDIQIGLDNGECSVDFESQNIKKTFQATNLISIKPGTNIKNGYNFKVELNCKLNGGLSVGGFIFSKTSIRSYENEYIKIDTDEDFTEVVFSPNPTKGSLQVISRETNNIISCSILNMAGVKLLNFENKSDLKSFDLDLSGFPIGLYVINFKMADGSVINKKIIKE